MCIGEQLSGKIKDKMIRENMIYGKLVKNSVTELFYFFINLKMVESIMKKRDFSHIN